MEGQPIVLYHGPLPPEIWLVVSEAYEGGFAVQSNFSRIYALEVALAASLGWITTVDPTGQTYSRVWRITVAGLTALNNKDIMK